MGHLLPMLARLAALMVFCLLLPPVPRAAADSPPVPSDWQSPLAVEHPLTGMLFRAGDGDRVAPGDLVSVAAEADFVLLGETHDNPDHHRLQAWVLAALAAQGPRPVVAFEMIDRDQADALAAYLESHPDDAAGLGAALGWEESGWPEWSMYRPIAEAALADGLPLRAADVARATQRDVGRQGLDALPERRRRTLGLDSPLPSALRKSLRRELMASHCDMLPEAALAPMMQVQRLRDAVMADSLIAAMPEAEGPVVLIAGRGHVRADRGVPWYLRRRLPEAEILTVGLFEVADDLRDWRAYLPDVPEAAPAAFDYLWFTPRVDDRDHCAEMEARIKAFGKARTEGREPPAAKEPK